VQKQTQLVGNLHKRAINWLAHTGLM